MSETKKEAFDRLKDQRVANAQKYIRMIGYLSATKYDWEPDEVRGMFAALRTTLREEESKFHRDPRWNK